MDGKDILEWALVGGLSLGTGGCIGEHYFTRDQHGNRVKVTKTPYVQVADEPETRRDAAYRKPSIDGHDDRDGLSGGPDGFNKDTLRELYRGEIGLIQAGDCSIRGSLIGDDDRSFYVIEMAGEAQRFMAFNVFGADHDLREKTRVCLVGDNKKNLMGIYVITRLDDKSDTPVIVVNPFAKSKYIAPNETYEMLFDGLREVIGNYNASSGNSDEGFGKSSPKKRFNPAERKSRKDFEHRKTPQRR